MDKSKLKLPIVFGLLACSLVFVVLADMRSRDAPYFANKDKGQDSYSPSDVLETNTKEQEVTKPVTQMYSIAVVLMTLSGLVAYLWKDLDENCEHENSF